MKPPTPSTVRNLPRAIAQCDEPVGEDGQREAAAALGLLHYLPDIGTQLPLMAGVERTAGQHGEKD